MSDITKVPDRLGQAVSALRSATYAAFLILTIVVVVCLVGLIVGGTYGVMHNGNDFDGNGPGGGGFEGGGDVIVLPLLR